MGKYGFVLADIQIASSVAERKSISERQIKVAGYTLPLNLRSVRDPEDLRLAIGRASAAYGKHPGETGGNPTKRLRLCIDAPDGWRSSEEIATQLAKPTVWSAAPTADPDELLVRIRGVRERIAKLGRLPEPPPGSSSVEKTTGSSTRYKRDPDVVAWVLEQARGRCEACTQPAPFITADGFPYLEVHHVKPLSEGGPDRVDNAIACCPKCHRELHYGADRASFTARLYAALSRLVAPT
jgi:5-methylcytosine-specific restriction protein A